MSASPYFLRLATKIFAFVSIVFLNSSLALASDDAHGAHEALPKHAETVFHFLGLPITNSMLMVWLVAAVIIFVAQKAG